MIKISKKKQAFDDIDFEQYYTGEPLNAVLNMLKNIGYVLSLMTVATFVSFGFRAMGLHESNYIMIYNLGVLFVAYMTDGYLYGVAASILGVLVFNYFFTQPYYTLVAYSPEYPVTFLIMLIAALFTSTLTARVKRESRRAEIRRRRIHILYQIEKNLLAVKSKQQLLEVSARDIGGLFDASVLVCAANLSGELNMRHTVGQPIFDSEKEATACLEAFHSGLECGAGTQLFSDCAAYYSPLIGQSGVLGVIGIMFSDANQLLESRKLFLDTVGAQISLALERERLYEKQAKVKMEMERERLRGDLLRAVSHDLKTPLTGILGSISTVLENYSVLDDDVRIDFLKRTYEDAEWLNNLVENILSMTRFDEGRITLKREMEAVEEIIAAAAAHVKEHTGQHEMRISIPHHLIMIPVDGTLIEQVLVNLLDNAIKHTPKGTTITVSVREADDEVIFEVSDNGPGISRKDIPFIFNRFYTTRSAGGKSRRGIGLGLAICKSIVEAHGGRIAVSGNPSGGSAFRFSLPAKE